MTAGTNATNQRKRSENMDPIIALTAFIGLPLLLYLVLAYYIPIWKEFLKERKRGKKDDASN
jgi:hypothetical protein